jgi:Zn-dependent protease with chaperone function
MSDPATPSQRPRQILHQIAAVSWEHPADRAALQALRSVPGFNEAVKKIVSFFGERGVRLLFQANAVRVGPTQFPRLHTLLTEVAVTMDWPDRPELFVSQTPFVNAGAVGIDRPFIVLNSGAVKLLNDDEMRVLIGHELGHIMSGHALYRTVALLILTLGFRNLPFLAGVALLPIKLALLEWYRKSELSADRAGLLASQDRLACMRVFMKLAGGGDPAETDVEAFMEQAREYEEKGGPLDTIYKLLNLINATHPFNTLRAGELQRWLTQGEYERILQGEYTHRGEQERARPYAEDLGEAAAHYGRGARDTVSQVADVAKRAASAFGKAFREGGKKESGEA